MEQLHVITGTPRSGSTLLCNVLNQNPRFHASSTSIMSRVLDAIQRVFSTAEEIKGDLARDRLMTEMRSLKVLVSAAMAFYDHINEPIIFDKSRGWSSNLLLLRTIAPNSKVIVTVRHPLNIWASVEKQHRSTALWDASQPNFKSLKKRDRCSFF